MPVETFAYIDSLNASNPPGSDGLVQGDDHIRGIKSTLKNTFPAITGATTATQATLNALQDNTHEFYVPVGAVVDFLDRVPTGWLELNGGTGSRTTHARLFALYGTTYGAGDGSTTFGLPDLRDRYRRQRSASYAVNATIAAQVGTHGHTATGATTLSIASDGAHAHGGITSERLPTTPTAAPRAMTALTTPTGSVDPGHAHTYGGRNSDANFGTATFGAPGSGNSSATSTAVTGISLGGASARHEHHSRPASRAVHTPPHFLRWRPQPRRVHCEHYGHCEQLDDPGEHTEHLRSHHLCQILIGDRSGC
jgi:microcystin-dependent protein